MVHIRPAAPGDAGPWADVVLEASPHLVLDARSEAHEMHTEPPDARRFVAEDGTAVVGVGRRLGYTTVARPTVAERSLR